MRITAWTRTRARVTVMWVSVDGERGVAPALVKHCDCYTCLRRRGVTDNGRPDWRGRHYDMADGKLSRTHESEDEDK